MSTRCVWSSRCPIKEFIIFILGLTFHRISAGTYSLAAKSFVRTKTPQRFTRTQRACIPCSPAPLSVKRCASISVWPNTHTTRTCHRCREKDQKRQRRTEGGAVTRRDERDEDGVMRERKKICSPRAQARSDTKEAMQLHNLFLIAVLQEQVCSSAVLVRHPDLRFLPPPQSPSLKNVLMPESDSPQERLVPLGPCASISGENCSKSCVLHPQAGVLFAK